MPTRRGLGDEGECDASVRERVRRPTPPAWQVASDFKTGKAIQSSPRDLKYHFFRCLATNNHEKGSVVTTHELSSSLESHVIEGGDHVRVCDMLVDVHLAALAW